MARYATHITTEMAPDEAFAYLADVTRYPEWDPSIIGVVQVVGARPEVGSTYDLTIKAVGTLRYRISRFSAPVRMVIVAKSLTLNSADEILVHPSGRGSIVTYDAHLSLRQLGGLLDPLLQLAFDRVGRRAAEGLRRALSGTTLESPSGHPRPGPPAVIHQ